MGVKDLWNIIAPSCDTKVISGLQGKTIAIDLSCWVVDSQMITDNAAQPKMYLRNLYFRTVNLLMQGTFPVFVLEGKAPELKHKEMARRNDLRRGNEERKTNRNTGRNQFNRILKECETMLELMGLKCVKGYGEAEAMCAYLNKDGLVDGCISQDSDCFLYGAKIVYKNFTTSGTVDEYTMEKIQRLYNIGRNKMIALALLCGCDYDEGVNKVGKEAALKLFKLVDDDDILDRLRSWSTHSEFNRMESELKDPNICTSCGHRGKLRVHAKSGCVDCGTTSKCDESYKEKRALISNEIAIRKKASLLEDFPRQDLIDEFLVRKGPMPSSLDLQWRQPKIVELVKFMERRLAWEPEYAFAKIFPLTTRWQLRHFANIPPQNRILMRGLMVPEKIKKIRNIKGVASYEIIWIDKDKVLEGLTLGKTSDKENDSDENDNDDTPDALVSVESQEAVRMCYAEMAEEFEAARQAKKKKPAKPRGRKKASAEEKENDHAAPATTEARKKPAARKSRKKAIEFTNKKIDEFFQVKKVSTLEESFESMTIKAKRSKPTNFANLGHPIASATPKRGPQFDKVLATNGVSNAVNDTLGKMFNELTPDDFPSEVEDDSLNMSAVIERVCNKGINEPFFDENIIQTLRMVENPEEHVEENSKMNEVCVENYEEREQSPRKSETELTEAHELSDEFDAFDVAYVPLNQRVKLPKQSDLDRKDKNKKLSLGTSDLLNDSD